MYFIYSFLMGAALACPIAVLGRWVRRRRLHQRLTVLSPAQRADILLPLGDERLGDTRKIAASLARGLRISTELTPAAAPDARGDEASPAEPMR